MGSASVSGSRPGVFRLNIAAGQQVSKGGPNDPTVTAGVVEWAHHHASPAVRDA
jgi:hypothetical protein